MKIIHHRLCYEDDAPVPFVETANMGGTLKPRFAIVHYTAGPSIESAIAAFTREKKRNNVSAHIIVGRGGEIVQLVPFDRVAWHAGRSRWRHGGRVYVGLNAHAVGIELVNAGPLTPLSNGVWRSWWGRHYAEEEVVRARHKHGGSYDAWMRYPAPQVQAALNAVRALVGAYGLLDVIGHDDVAPGRKLDPGPAFPMDEFRAGAVDPPPPQAETINRKAGPVCRLFSWFNKRK